MTAAAFVTAVCVSEPIRSHDNTRMWATESMNSRGLQQHRQLVATTIYLQQPFIVTSFTAFHKRHSFY